MKELITNVNVFGLEDSIKASKYPMSVDIDSLNTEATPNTIKMAHSPVGHAHDQWLTGVTVQFDLTCTNKLWVEAERYRFLYFVSSQSTMHRITKFDLDEAYIEYVDGRVVEIMKEKVDSYNFLHKKKDDGLIDQSELEALEDLQQCSYLNILYTNPAGFRLTARMTTNYRQLKTIYLQRKNHRLPEWREFCKWVESLPCSFLITGGSND